MGSLTGAIKDQERDQEIEQNQAYLNDLAEQIRTALAYGPEFEARRWLETNREKILRNRRLINLIG